MSCSYHQVVVIFYFVVEIGESCPFVSHESAFAQLVDLLCLRTISLASKQTRQNNMIRVVLVKFKTGIFGCNRKTT